MIRHLSVTVEVTVETRERADGEVLAVTRVTVHVNAQITDLDYWHARGELELTAEETPGVSTGAPDETEDAEDIVENSAAWFEPAGGDEADR